MAYRDASFELRPIGYVRSSLKSTQDAPKQGSEGAPEAWLDIEQDFAQGAEGLKAGDEILVLTWLHLGDRECLKTHPRNDRSRPLIGVFATRSPSRPNPIGIHPATIIEVNGPSIRVSCLEAIDGTPVLDVKPCLGDNY